MKSNIARTGKVKVPKWGILFTHTNELKKVYETRYEARIKIRDWNPAYFKVVRLTGTVSYTVAK